MDVNDIEARQEENIEQEVRKVVEDPIDLRSFIFPPYS